MPHDNLPLVVILEGNIAACKSTVCKHIRSQFTELKVEVVQEPVEEWREMVNRDGNVTDLLQVYYDSPETNAFVMQMTTLSSRLYHILQELERCSRGEKLVDILIIERSLRSDYEVFGEKLRPYFTEIEKTIYDSYYRWFSQLLPEPNGYIYIDTPPEVCSERMKIRARPEEKTVPLEYLTELKDRFDALMSRIEAEDRCPIVRVSGTDRQDVVLSNVKEMILSIRERTIRSSRTTTPELRPKFQSPRAITS